ncbi:MAG TPA: peptidyl-prolyl cis-trans isomerase [Candidatus Eisenbacteria bacterium]|nr:peptidyl-prolyl cis-trans isomerase [Candidatus Eisenbacteria bacterium]
MIRFLQTPGPAKKIILGGLLLVVCVMMVVTLVPGGMFGDYFGRDISTAGVVAKVGSDDITLQQVAQRARMIGRQQFRGNVPPTLMPFLMQRAADGMITQGSLAYEADRMGLGVSDKELVDYLHQGQFGQLFFPGGNFIGQQQYEDFIQNQFGLSVAMFEKELKDQIAQQKLLAAVSAAATVSDKEVEEQVKKQDTKVKFDYAVLTLDDIKKQVKVTDVELKAFYDQNKQQYVNSIPEKRKARYILIDTTKLANSIPITQADLQAYYNQHQDEFRIPETVTARHILIKTPTPGPDGKVDPKGVEAAKAKAEDIQKQLKAGADFADLAKKYSEDPGSAQEGGLLPPLTRGRTVPEFEQAAFNTPKGQTTGIIRTSYGFHIIRVEDKQSARVKPLDEVKAQIEPAIRQQKAAVAAQSLANSVRSIARSGGLDKAAADKGLTVTTTDLLAQSDALPGLGSAQELSNALFSAKKGEPPALSQTPQGYAIYQVTEIQPPQTPTFEQIKQQVEDQFRAQRAQALLAQKTQELSDRARAEHDLKKAAKELGATVKTSDLVTAAAQVPDIGAMSGQANVAFSLGVGEISGPVRGDMGSGIVLAVVEKQEPSPQDVKLAWDRAKETLLDQKRQVLEGLYVQNLRDKLEKEGKIKINKKEMERMSRLGEGS